ncbi:MAG: hypothetical protein WD845_15535 [Pirellulales bacterium]
MMEVQPFETLLVSQIWLACSLLRRRRIVGGPGTGVVVEGLE